MEDGDDEPDAGAPAPSQPLRPPGDVVLRSPAEMAEYVADMTAELARLTRGAGLDLLAYLLDIVHLEAQTARSRKASSPRR